MQVSFFLTFLSLRVYFQQQNIYVMEDKLNAKVGKQYERVYTTEQAVPKVEVKSERLPPDKLHDEIFGMFRRLGSVWLLHSFCSLQLYRLDGLAKSYH